MTFLIGTSGYSYKEWCGTFYPDALSTKHMLRFYATKFSTVEINNTFYRMPTPKLLQGWCEETPPHFRFVLKAPQKITHITRLKEPQLALDFFAVAEGMGDKFGGALFQLPPNFKQNLERLEPFLAALPPRKIAFEFRHESWFNDDTWALLRAHGAALCIADSDDLQTPLVATAPFAYFRLRSTNYDEAAIKAWADRIREWKDALVFFKHEDSGTGPLYGEMMQKFLGA
jgi:uncharacterized protein YecE (DUF72 family)